MSLPGLASGSLVFERAAEKLRAALRALCSPLSHPIDLLSVSDRQISEKEVASGVTLQLSASRVFPPLGMSVWCGREIDTRWCPSRRGPDVHP